MSSTNSTDDKRYTRPAPVPGTAILIDNKLGTDESASVTLTRRELAMLEALITHAEFEFQDHNHKLSPSVLALRAKLAGYFPPNGQLACEVDVEISRAL